MNHIQQLLSNAEGLLAANRFAEAESHLRAVIAAHPNLPAAHHALGVALIRLQRHGEAIAEFEKSLQLAPSAEAWLNLIQLHFFTGKKSEAVAAARAAAAAFPNDPRIVAEFARTLERSGDSDAALASSLDAVQRFGKIPLLVIHAANLLFTRGKVAEAAALYRECMAQHPADHRIHSALLFTLHFLPGMTPAKLLEEHLAWNCQHAAALAPQNSESGTQNSELKTPLRIGYVSPDFRNHGVGRFIAPLLEHHTRSEFETFAYSDVHTPDALTHRIRAAVHAYRPTFGISDAQLADLIRADQIDILIDLTMHMPSNRLLAFARKPAPVQITYLAYCSTTGLPQIDYRITDPFLDPPGDNVNDLRYTEKSLVIPSYWCYEAPSEAASIPSRPARDPGDPITFGCLNNFAKVSSLALETWSAILQRVPHSRLLLHAPEGEVRREVAQTFERFHITPSRLQFAGRLPMAEYLRLHAQCDIALDPFPYNGGTTTCDALFMGTPAIVLSPQADALAISRAGVSLLSQIGLERLIAHNLADYVSLAAELAQDAERLAALQQSLPETMRRSPLMNPLQFNQSIEAAYREVWRQWCAKRQG